jgi:hypothetical protein
VGPERAFLLGTVLTSFKGVEELENYSLIIIIINNGSGDNHPWMPNLSGRFGCRTGHFNCPILSPHRLFITREN